MIKEYPYIGGYLCVVERIADRVCESGSTFKRTFIEGDLIFSKPLTDTQVIDIISDLTYLVYMLDCNPEISELDGIYRRNAMGYVGALEFGLDGWLSPAVSRMLDVVLSEVEEDYLVHELA